MSELWCHTMRIMFTRMRQRIRYTSNTGKCKVDVKKGKESGYIIPQSMRIYEANRECRQRQKRREYPTKRNGYQKVHKKVASLPKQQGYTVEDIREDKTVVMVQQELVYCIEFTGYETDIKEE
eukprot:736578_1